MTITCLNKYWYVWVRLSATVYHSLTGLYTGLPNTLDMPMPLWWQTKHNHWDHTCSNLWVSQNGRFMMNPVYHGTWCQLKGKFWILGSLKLCKMNSPGPFALPNYPKKFAFCVALVRIFTRVSTRNNNTNFNNSLF